ncbi:MAG: hypothetical protein LQ348_003090 [Seirophora lacunosa]|nr:MAG: hypothetical protein LQ348_003090 [Seirophora lacunosa]
MAIGKAAKKHSCSVMLKTGKAPGVMMAEGDDEAQVKQWVQGVKRLKYKNYRLLRLEAVEGAQLPVERGNVQEFEWMKDLSASLAASGVLPWWTEHMGFTPKKASKPRVNGEMKL